MNSVLRPVRKIRGGAKVPHMKNTADCKTIFMPSPPEVILPMQQHIGAPCQPTVKVGDEVKVGQVIGDSEAFVSAPIHASVSGKVKAIKPVLMPGGQKCDAVVIESDGLDTYADTIGPQDFNDKASLLAAIRGSGLVGIGGAGFPLSVKLAIKDDSNVDTLVINGAECEPYITSDYRESVEFPGRVIAGIEIVMNALKLKKALIGIEDNKPQGIEALKKILEKRPAGSLDIDIVELPARYPQGAEKMLIYATTGRRVPVGGLPSDAGCIVMNISSVSVLCYYIWTGIPLIAKRLTVAGGAVNEPQNVMVPIGTPIGQVIEFCGGFKVDPTKIITGGPMMGIAQYDKEMPVLKQNNAILALTEDETQTPEEHPCIRCGRCVYVCPMSLMPALIDRASRNEDAVQLNKLGVMSCMECGSCAFVCPSKRPLVQYMKHAKTVARKRVSE